MVNKIETPKEGYINDYISGLSKSHARRD